MFLCIYTHYIYCQLHGTMRPQQFHNKFFFSTRVIPTWVGQHTNIHNHHHSLYTSQSLISSQTERAWVIFSTQVQGGLGTDGHWCASQVNKVSLVTCKSHRRLTAIVRQKKRLQNTVEPIDRRPSGTEWGSPTPGLSGCLRILRVFGHLAMSHVLYWLSF